MRLITTLEDLRQTRDDWSRQGRTVGLLPTMGYLHAGHLSHARTARAENDIVVASIFVNPTQFGPSEDLARYPRDLPRDTALLADAGVDAIFAPTADAMYPAGFATWVDPAGQLTERLEAARRPGHFRGVATVVLKLFNLVQPDHAYFGQKDAQQVRIVEQMVRDLSVPVTVRVCPIVREADGLALSSRNQYLEADERRQATILHRALVEARRRIEAGERDVAVVRQAMIERIASASGAVLDYAVVVDADSLETPARLVPGRAILLALAVKFGGTRLIDNLSIQVSV
jgi:pantoate--beta-alanine ligase